MANYTDLDDQPINFLEERGELSHTQFLLERYPLSTRRFFRYFGEILPEISPDEEEESIVEM